MFRLMTDWQVREASVEDVRYLTEICEDDSVSRASTPELESQPEALFVVQVWGGLNDCAVPGLSINGDKLRGHLYLEQALFVILYRAQVRRRCLWQQDRESVLLSPTSPANRSQLASTSLEAELKMG